MLGVSNETGESKDSPNTPVNRKTTPVVRHRLVAMLPPFHQTSQRLFVVVVAVRYRKVLSGCCRMVSYRCRGRGRQRRPSPWWAIANGGGSGDDGGGGGRERRLYLFGNGCATNKQPMPNIVHTPNNRILVHSVPAHSAERSGLNSRMRKFRRNDQEPE